METAIAATEEEMKVLKRRREQCKEAIDKLGGGLTWNEHYTGYPTKGTGSLLQQDFCLQSSRQMLTNKFAPTQAGEILHDILSETVRRKNRNRPNANPASRW